MENQDSRIPAQAEEDKARDTEIDARNDEEVPAPEQPQETSAMEKENPRIRAQEEEDKATDTEIKTNDIFTTKDDAIRDINNFKNNVDVEAEQRPRVDLDTILVEEIGQFGLYQLRTLLLAIVVVIFGAWAAVEYIFTTGRISTRCLIPECESRTDPADFEPSWIFNAIPRSGSSFDNCNRFVNTTFINGIVDAMCPATLFDQSTEMSCEDYVFENTNTVVYDYGLACDEWRRSLIGTVRTFGTLAALPITGFVSDGWGRRTALAISGFNTAWIGAVRYFADTYVGFMISEVAEATFGSGIFSCAYILLMELVGPKYRVAVGATMNTSFALGQVILGFIAWGIQDWRLLTITLYIPMLITISYFWLMSESVRWYMSKGRYEDSERALKEIARVNKKHLSDKSLELLRQTAEEDKRIKAMEEETKATEPWLIVQVFQNRPILIRCAVSPIWWITNTFIYYGLSINSVNLSGNSYLNFVAVAAIEIPGFWTAFALMGRIGRKPVLIMAFWICGACQIGYILMPDDLEGLSLALYLIGKFSIAMVMTAIYVYTAELYPTKYRHSLFAFSSMMGRIGSMLAPLTPALGDAVWADLPFALFGGFAILSGLLVLITPETLGTKMPDTMQEAADIGKTKRNN